MKIEFSNGSIIRSIRSEAQKVIRGERSKCIQPKFNETTLAALEEVDKMKSGEIEYETYNDVDELFRALVLGLDDKDVTYEDESNDGSGE